MLFLFFCLFYILKGVLLKILFDRMDEDHGFALSPTTGFVNRNQSRKSILLCLF